MGNAINYQENLQRNALERMSKALRSFIEHECPIYLTALKSDDHRLKETVVKEFNKHFTDYVFDNIFSILPHLERLRINRINQLEQITSTKFNCPSQIKLSCLPCKINDYLTVAYFDTGCSISCITLANARKLNLISLIDRNVNGVAVGFGCSRSIVGFLTNLPLQVNSELLFNINFVVINQADADFVLIGYDFLVKFGLKMDYRNGKIIFPQQIINEHKLDFMPCKSRDRDLVFDLFKYEMLEQNRNLMRSYFNCSGNSSNKYQQQNSSVERCSQPGKSLNNNLYIRISINGKQLYALIDTGADTSKISDNLALQLDILRFIDYDKRKMAHGLGSVLSIGRIPPIPIKFESSNENDKQSSTILFVPFEVLKENRVNVLLFGSDFFTHYGCYLDFDTRSINIPLKSPCKYNLDEQAPKSVHFKDDDKSLVLNHNYLKNHYNSSNGLHNQGKNSDKNDELLNLYYESSPELDQLSRKIYRREKEFHARKKIKKYKLLFTNKKQVNRDHLVSSAWSILKDQFKTQIADYFVDSGELDDQTESFLIEKSNLINESVHDIQVFKNQTSDYCNDFMIPEYEIKDSLIRINLVN